MKRTWCALLGALVATACSSAADSPATEGGSPDGGEAPATDADAGPGGTDPGGSGGGPVAKNLTLSAVSFKNVGRYGEALRVAVKGADTTKQTSAVFVRFVDDAGAPVVSLDTDWDGVPDSAERRFHFDESTIGQASFTGSVIIPNVFSPSSKIAKVVVAIEDEAGGRSATKTQDIALQATRGPNEACDPTKLADRCADGQGCVGTPPTCQPGGPPELVRVGYFGGNAPRMIFQGTEPDEDIDEISVEFLDAAGDGKTVNLGSEENPDMSSGITIDAKSGADGASFSVSSEPIKGFETLSPKIAATVSDSHGHHSARVVAAATSLPVRSVGQACDYTGFDTCTSGNVCAPGLASTPNKCSGATSLRTKKCSDGAALDPAKGNTKSFGTTNGASLWDAPAGCVPNDATGRPESAVRLHLAAAAATLIVSTALPETDFDTAVYVVKGCAASSSGALGCNDDVRGYSSTLTLNNVPAGDYTIIIEAVQPRGGHFGVSVEVK
jgi:hypothetical protein